MNRNIVVGKLDHSFSDADRISARYYINDATTTGNGSYGIAASDPLATNTDVRIQSFLLTHTHTFGPSLVNNFQVISTIAEVTFYGHDQNGRAVSVTGRLDVDFSDWGD